MEQAIKLAIEGGWRKGDPLQNSYFDMVGYTAFLDPLFWQCLGKTMGWYPKEIKLGENWNMEIWKNHWHNLIDHLAEGKDIDSFFKTLLEPDNK